jgi:NitT/TauT family transport system ATP-binding protein
MEVRLIHLSKQFNEKVLFKDLNISFQEGRINCLMGASGIGKTTLINILMGFVKQDAGEVQGIKGRRVSAVFQEDRLIEHWDALKNVKLVCEKNISIEQIKQDLYRVGIEEVQGKPVNKFSGGMRRRVAIVRAMLASSDLLILDEPLKGLDESLKLQVIEYVKEKAKGKTVIAVTHDKEEVQLLNAHLITL